ncbi:AAA family ATPase [Phascolarctobacterium sp.]|uniref:AAA family ATPase n=1 Tax=Phascolarctobacterium sp. TaxID=2049039 RepID=UPI0025FAB46A|nr:AAA family ATPase [Phascolarctobacterium sp.]
MSARTKHFAGLAIAKHTQICNQWMNKYPTIFVSLKDVDGISFQDACAQLSLQFADLYKEYAFLLDANDIDNDDRNIFQKIKAREASLPDLSRALSTLMKMLNAYYGKPVILLLDEYDVPIAKACSHGYYTEMMNIIKPLLSTSLKDNPNLCFALITGCLRIAKESVFTGTNNFISDSIVRSNLKESFGFTQNEVDKLLAEANAEAYAETIRTWYDGYHFDAADVYCPWDVISYLYDLQRNPQAKSVSYWRNTSDNSIIRSFIDYASGNITEKLETLLAGGFIVQKVDDSLTYDYLHSSEENLWSVLYLTGYLTKVRDDALSAAIPDSYSALMIPNEEIKEIYETTVMKWFADSAQASNRKALFAAVWGGDSEMLTKEMTKLLRMTISYHDYREDFYHAFLDGIFTGAGYVVESNREHGDGRSDVVVKDIRNGRIAVFEAKYVKTLNKLQDACDLAIDQINKRSYAEDFQDDYDDILCYGIAFFKKRCLVNIK